MALFPNIQSKFSCYLTFVTDESVVCIDSFHLVPGGGLGKVHHMVPLVHDAVRDRGHHKAPFLTVYQSNGLWVLYNEFITKI